MSKEFRIGDNCLAKHLGLWQNARVTGFENGTQVTLGSGERITASPHELAEKKVPYKKERRAAVAFVKPKPHYDDDDRYSNY